MTTFKLKQIALALFLTASLLVGSASSCTCSHNEAERGAKSDCHSHHDSSERIESNAVDAECACFVDYRTPAVVSKSESKKLKAGTSISNSDRVVPDPGLIATASFRQLPPESDQTPSYSEALRSLLSARAPPRL